MPMCHFDDTTCLDLNRNGTLETLKGNHHKQEQRHIQDTKQGKVYIIKLKEVHTSIKAMKLDWATQAWEEPPRMFMFGAGATSGVSWWIKWGHMVFWLWTYYSLISS